MRIYTYINNNKFYIRRIKEKTYSVSVTMLTTNKSKALILKGDRLNKILSKLGIGYAIE